MLLKRADVKSHDKYGQSCLHFILAYDILSGGRWGSLKNYNHDEFKSVLMAIIIAGGDVKAIDEMAGLLQTLHVHLRMKKSGFKPS